MNITTLRAVKLDELLDELLEDCPEVSEVMNSTDLPWIFGDCRYALISRSDLQGFLEELEEQEVEDEEDEQEDEVADQSDPIREQCALAIERIANLPEDVFIVL